MAAARHEVHLSAYKSALEEHPELKSFDSSLQHRTNKVIDSIKAQADSGSFSVHASYLEAYGCVLEVGQDVAKMITDSKSEVWKNEALRSLVMIYFENTTKTLEFFNTVENFVGKAEMGELIIQSAVDQFEKESHSGGNKKNKYEKTLEKLKKFKDMEHYFDIEKFKNEFELVKKEQVSLLEEVSKLKKKIEEEQHHIEECKKISNWVFGAALAVTLVLAAVATCGVGAVAVAGAESVAIAGAESVEAVAIAEAIGGEGVAIGGEGVAIGGAEATISAIMIGVGWEVTSKKLDDILKKQKDIFLAVEKGEITNKEAMKTIRALLEELITKMSSLLDTVDFAIETKEEEVATENSMRLVKQKVVDFTKKIKEVAENVDKNRELVIKARNDILGKI